MVSQGYATKKQVSPIGIGGAIAFHGVVAAVLILMPKEMITERIIPSLVTSNIPIPDDPPPPPPPAQPEKQVETRIDRVDSMVKTPTQSATVIDLKPPIITPLDPPLLPPIDKPVATPEPKLIGAVPDPKYMSSFQPPYPPAMQRLEQEGSVTVRLRIGADGKVLSVEQVSATDDAFWRVTERQALNRWRFRPATRDGVAVESVRTMTVHFRLN